LASVASASGAELIFMSEARMVAEITADTKGFEAGLERTDRLAEQFTHKLSHHMQKAFGAAFWASILFEGPRKMIEQSEKISEGATKLHVTTDEYQMLEAAAKEAGQGVEEFIKAQAKQGHMLDTVISKAEKYREQIRLSTKQIEDYKEMQESLGMKGFLGGAMGTAGAIGLGAYKGGMTAIQLINASLDTLLKGATGGRVGMPVSAEDSLLDIMQMWGWADRPLKGLDQPIPRRPMDRNQKEYDNEMRRLHMLEYQEDALKQAMRANRGLSWLSPGAMPLGIATRLPMVLAKDPGEKLNDQLEKVHEDLQLVKAAIEKLGQ
jgi:uncharacterized protein (DUF1778 family)